MKPLHLLLSVVAVACLAAVPLGVTNTYYLHLIETIMIYAILLFGLDIVVGYTGQVSLGHAGLFGIGSYVAGVLFFHLQLPIWLTLPAAILIAAAFGAVLALPALRVTGPYLAMVTLAFGTIIQILINEMTFLTEGPLGIKIPKPSIGGHVLNKSEYFWLVAALLVLSLIVVHRILKSHLGRSFEALRDSPIASDCMGVSVYRHKVFAFVISAGFAGLAGRCTRTPSSTSRPTPTTSNSPSCSCWPSSWAGARAAPARCWARPSSCCCPRCWTTSPPSG